jgi:hypothetical protein
LAIDLNEEEWGKELFEAAQRPEAWLVSAERLRGNNTTFTDSRGAFAGSAIRQRDGSTSQFDERGHFVGSVRDVRRRNKGRSSPFQQQIQFLLERRL